MNRNAVLLILLTCICSVSAMYFGYVSLWALAIFLTLLLFFSAVMIICSFWQVSVRQSLEKEVAEKGEEARLTVHCYNKGIFLFPKVRLQYRDGDEKEIAVCPGTQDVDVGYVFQRKGKYLVGLEKVVVYDAFGIFCHRIRCQEPETLFVLPRAGISALMEEPETGKNSEEGVKKKQLEDRTTVSDLREYQYGDTINSINWKATAKRNEVIVNHYENEFCTRVFVYVDHSAYPDLDDHACDLALTCVKSVLDHNGMVTLLYSGKDGVLDSKTVKSFQEYGIYLAEAPAFDFTQKPFWEQDRIWLEKAFFQKDTYNQAFFYLHNLSPEMEQFIRLLENLHIKVNLYRIAFQENNPYPQTGAARQKGAGQHG